jgi:hypothetical protein
MKKPWLTILIYLILGPPIGFVFFTAFAIVWNGDVFRLQVPTTRPPTTLLVGLVAFTYMLGWLPAVAAGLGVVGLKTQSFWRVTLVGMVVGSISAIVWSLTYNWGGNVTLAPRLWATTDAMAFLSALCAFSTVVCWLAARLCENWSNATRA